jgi:ATP-dependent helicase/nuclease subunit A
MGSLPPQPARHPVSTAIRSTIISASAGTGKTHQLVNRYLALLFLQRLAAADHRTHPDRIIAMTFTRMGAGEFTRRILAKVAKAAGDDRERAELLEQLNLLVQGNAARSWPGMAEGVDLRVDPAALRQALAEMIDSLDRLALCTIDSFMARSVQTLAFELGLGGFEILEDSSIVQQRSDLLARVFAAVPPEALRGFYQIVKSATLKTSRSLKRELDAFVQQFHGLYHGLPEPDSWGGSAFWENAPPEPALPDWRERARVLAEEVVSMEMGHGTAVKSFAKALDWIGDRAPGTAGKVPAWLDEDGRLASVWPEWPAGDWQFKFQRSTVTVPRRVMDQLRPILESWIAAECRALAQKTAAVFSILRVFDQLYELHSRGAGQLQFADLPVVLGRGLDRDADGTLETLAYRWYQRFDHWLLDEFQDTSRVQWDVLGKWVDEAIQDPEGEKSVFVVGDVKQSIYRWRGGDQRLLTGLPGQYPGRFLEVSMAESWRSRPAVLELVNRICRHGTGGNPALVEACFARWMFEPHVACERKQDLPGYAGVLMVGEDAGEAGEAGEIEDSADGGEFDDSAGEGGDEAADKVAPQARAIRDILTQTQALRRGLSCAVLVRKKANGRLIANWLRSHGVPEVMMEGETSLADQSPLVLTILDVLRWLSTPAHTQGRWHSALTPLDAVLLKDAKGTDLGDPRVWKYWRDEVARCGAAIVTSRWCVQLVETETDPFARYCLALLEGKALQAGPEASLPDWIASLAAMSVRETAAAGTVHVMTIHSSKGLGFDLVFVPDIDRQGGFSDTVLIRRDAEGAPVACLAHPRKWLQCWDPLLRDLCAQQSAEKDLETMCVLYVALTRAAEATFVILPEKRPRNSSPARDWVCAGAEITPDLPASPWGGSRVLWQAGSADFAAGRKIQPPSNGGAGHAVQLSPAVPRRQRRKPSELGHVQPQTAAPALISHEGQKFGTAVHKVFEQIEWWDGRCGLEGEPTHVEHVRACLASPAIRELFTRHDPGDEALRELPIEYVDQGEWWSGVIDRLVIRKNPDGSVRKGIVVDFKTDKVSSLEELRARHEGQVDIYKRTLRSALNLAGDQVEVILLSTRLGGLVLV